MTLYRVSYLALIFSAVWSIPSRAAENVKYAYDALGRLVAVEYTGGVAGGTNTAMTYDAAGNRSTVVITGATGSANSVFVLMMGGYLIVPTGTAN